MLGAILIISGPSGSGKSTLCKEMFKSVDNAFFSISTTTRPMREGEIDGVDYYFVSKDKFQKDIKNSEFLEWAEVHGNYYGTSLGSVQKALNDGKLIVFDIDVQGFELVKNSPFSDFCTSIFILPPNMSMLKERLNTRGTDTKDTVDNRIKNATDELKYLYKYDYLIVNDDLKTARGKLKAIAKSAKLKPESYKLKSFLDNWLKS